MRRSRVLAAALACLLCVPACGDDDGGGAGPAPSGTGGATTTASATTAPAGDDEGCTEERKGGRLTMVPSVVINPLDPIAALGASRGYQELAAIYDVLMRYDPDTREYEGQLAESLEPNDDFTVWTMKLREGIRYGNGDVLTAEDVKFNVERMAASPRVAAGMAQRITSEVIDDHTIRFTLDSPWTNLPYFFAHGGGLIANPRVVQERGGALSTNPAGAGAGPYEFVSFAPEEEVVLRAKDDYWGGPVCIETIRFIANPTAQVVLDAFLNEEIDAFFITDKRVIDLARDEDSVNGRSWIFGSDGVQINSGRGTNLVMADVRLRRAVAYALDTEVLNQRVWDGRGLMTTGVTHPDQLVHPGVDGPPYDPDEARGLVAEVKAETGWDGSVRLNCTSSPQHTEYSIAVQAMLSSVGFSVRAENLPAAEHSQKVLVEGNYDLACSSATLFDEAPERGLGQFLTGGPQNRTGYGTPEMDAAIKAVDEANGLDEMRAAIRRIQEIWNEDVPSAWTNAGEWFIGWGDHVRGVRPHISGVVLLDDAWLEG